RGARGRRGGGRARRRGARPPSRRRRRGRIAWRAMSADLQSEAVALLQRLIRFRTVNPPGDERACQEFLAERLSAVGFECELLGAVPDRPNLVARLRGREEGPTLGLLGHVDTVLATPEEWERDPWSGDVADG